MSTVTRTKHVPAVDVEEELYHVCDFPGCGKRTTSKNFYVIDQCDVRVFVNHREGSSFPEGGYGTEVDIDVCPDCFQNKLIPWLESQGVKINTKTWNH